MPVAAAPWSRPAIAVRRAAVQPNDPQRFADLGRAPRVWAIGAVNGEIRRLCRLHDKLVTKLEFGDRIVYLGNLVGPGGSVLDTLDELLAFRLEVLARPGSFAADFCFLRGQQEEMWQKLLQLQFANNAREVLEWMLSQGIGTVIEAYGGTIDEARRAASAGALLLTRWGGRMRQAMRAKRGHEQILASLRRAAYTQPFGPGAGSLLFVHAGLDPSRPLDAQKDNFWWHAQGFHQLEEPYAGFTRLVRGHDPQHPGLLESPYAVTVDAGCGHGGPLMAACFDAAGQVVDRVTS